MAGLTRIKDFTVKGRDQSKTVYMSTQVAPWCASDIKKFNQGLLCCNDFKVAKGAACTALDDADVKEWSERLEKYEENSIQASLWRHKMDSYRRPSYYINEKNLLLVQ